MKFILHKNEELPAIYCKGNTIDKVSHSFLKLTSFSELDLLGKSLGDLNRLLRLDGQACLEEIEDEKLYYIFTKEDKPREVSISSRYLSKIEERVYYFKKVQDTSLDDIIKNNFSLDKDPKRSASLHTIDGLILLKANNEYINLLESLNISTSRLIGKPAKYKEFLLNSDSKLGHSYKLEVPFVKRDKSIIYLDVFVMPLYVDGKEKYWLNVIRDVTESVLKKENIENQKEQMKIVLDNVSDKIVILNNQREFIYANKAALNEIKNLFNEEEFKALIKDKKITGYMKMLESFKINKMDGEEISFQDIPVERVLRGEAFSRYKFIGTSAYSTTYNEVHGIPIYDDYGNQDGGILIFKDITSKIILEEYNVLKEKTRDLFLNYASLSYPDFIIKYINDEGYRTLKKMNPQIKDLLSLIGKNFFDLYKIDDDEFCKLKKNIKQLLQGKSSSSHKCIHRFRIDGKFKYIKTIYQPVYNSCNEVDKIKVVGIDITKEKDDNEKLRKALKTQDEIFVNVSHELKTPLHLIFSASQLMRQRLEKDKPSNVETDIYYNNEIIIQNCYRLTKLINNILDISKIESGFYQIDLSNKDIVASTENIIDSIAAHVEEKGLKIVFDTEIEEKIIALDIDKFERIILNIISNAIKFSKPKGIIFVNLYNKDDFIEIDVSDQGIGIATENLDKIFNKFYQENKSLTRHTEGSGIGLALVKSLVELHGGNISADSVLGEGSTFRVRFPNKITENENNKKARDCNKDILETIRFEMSDIY